MKKPLKNTVKPVMWRLTGWIAAHFFSFRQINILCCVHSCHHHWETLIFQVLGGGEIRLLHGVAVSTPRGVEGDKDIFVFDEFAEVVVTELNNVWGLFSPCGLWFLLFGCFLFGWATHVKWKNINSRTLFHLMLAESRHCFNFATSEKNTLFEQRIGENNRNRNTLSDSRGKCHLREINF